MSRRVVTRTMVEPVSAPPPPPARKPWRVLTADDPQSTGSPAGPGGPCPNVRAAREAAPAARSVELPRPTTELTKLLAGDATLCVPRRREQPHARRDLGVPRRFSDASVPGQAPARGEADAPEVSSPAMRAPARDADPPQHAPPGDALYSQLKRVIDAWPHLPPAVQAVILTAIGAE